MNRGIFLSLVAVSTIAACSAADNIEAPGSSTQVSTGQPVDVSDASSAPPGPIPQLGNGLTYNGGPILPGTVNLYSIWYGNWAGNTAPPILTDFAKTIGGSPLYKVATTYSDNQGRSVSGLASFAGAVTVGATRGNALRGFDDIQGIVTDVLSGGLLPVDENGIYFIMSSEDVGADGFCTTYCGFHEFVSYNGKNIKYAFIPDPGHCTVDPTRGQPCVMPPFQTGPSPNGDKFADSMASVYLHELAETVTDPVLDAWGGLAEMGDKCVLNGVGPVFGSTYRTSSGAVANIHLGNRDFLLQELWVNDNGGYCAMSAPSPHGGAPAPIPGTIEAEDYDEGGEGVAYFDTTPGNAGGAYRTDDVDIEATNDTGGGYDVGWTASGEWMHYSTNLQTSGWYTIALRLSATTDNNTMHVEVDGTNVTGTIAIPNTGGWQNWATVAGPAFRMSAGHYSVKVVFETGGANLNWIQFASAPCGQITCAAVGANCGTLDDGCGHMLDCGSCAAPQTCGSGGEANVCAGRLPHGGKPWPIPGTLEAEDYDDGPKPGTTLDDPYYDTTPGNAGGAYRNDDVDIEATSDQGGGYDVGWTAPNEFLKFYSNVKSAGPYVMQLRVAAPNTGCTIHVDVNGEYLISDIPVPNTGGWQSWVTVSTGGFYLKPGPATVRVEFLSGGCNLNWVQFIAGTAHAEAAWPIPGTIEAEDYDDGGPWAGYSDSTPGNLGGAYRSDDVDIEATTDIGGGYDVGWTTPNEYLKYSTNIASAGWYTVALRVASPAAGNTIDVAVDGVVVARAIAVPNTGGWQNWVTVTSPAFKLSAGLHGVTVGLDTGGCNLNWIQFASAQCVPTTCFAALANCGSIDDGCGGTVDCGSCTAPATCGGAGGRPNVCGPAKCATHFFSINCVDFYRGAHVEYNGHNWTCSDPQCGICPYPPLGCFPGVPGCERGTLWVDDGVCTP